MAAKKKIQKKKQTRSKRTAGKKVMATNRLGKKRGILKKKSANRKPARKKAAVKTNPVGKKTIGVSTARALKKRVREKSQSVDTVAFSPEGPVARSGRQSGDLQGLSSVEAADSESVDELLEEGNAFEADAVKGVEDADDADEKEVRTHEVPEDDLPDEYRDKE
jgi:N utilization substance protein A